MQTELLQTVSITQLSLRSALTDQQECVRTGSSLSKRICMYVPVLL